MAMTMNGQVQLPAARDVVWAKLNDPDVLKSCIPGNEQFDKVGDNEFHAIATVKVRTRAGLLRGISSVAIKPTSGRMMVMSRRFIGWLP